MIDSGDVIMSFLSLLDLGRDLAGVVVIKEECQALQDEMLAVFGLPFESLMGVC